MSNKNDDTFINYNFNRELPPGIPNMPFVPPNIFPGAPFPPGSLPIGGPVPPIGNFPGENLYPIGIPNSPPPNFTPKQNNPNVQYISNNPNTKFVSGNSIRFCLFKFTYIWQRNGRNFWAYLINVDRFSISGFRWIGRTWVYFGLALSKIDSFLCHSNFRSETDTINSPSYHKEIKKEHGISGDKEICSIPITNIDLPEFKEDYSSEFLSGDDKNLLIETPYLKSRIINFSIVLEVTYPINYDNELKNSIQDAASDACNDARLILSSSRSCDDDTSIIENINSSSTLIPRALRHFSTSFINNLKKSNITQDIVNSIDYNMREETHINHWNSYFY